MTVRPVLSLAGALVLCASAFTLPGASAAPVHPSVRVARPSGGFHQYSIAQEWSAWGRYLGVSSRRRDSSPSHAHACSGVGTGSDYFQTQWLVLPGKYALELGTDHRCNLSFWYWGFFDARGAWRQLGSRVIEPFSEHTFSIARSAADPRRWEFVVDGAVLGAVRLPRPMLGMTVALGVESYAADTSGVELFTDLRYRSEGSRQWLAWKGRDWSGTGEAMVGTWLSDRDWLAGQRN